MTSLRTFEDLLAAGRGDTEAIAASGAPPLTYNGLRALAAETIAALNGFGIGRNDRVAIVLPNGPEMAAAFLAIGVGRDVGAAQSRLPRRRIRILHERSQRQGAGRRSGQLVARDRGGEKARHRAC